MKNKITLSIIAGLPCSGKTTYAKQLSQKIKNSVIISAEEFCDIAVHDFPYPIVNFNRHWADYVINILKFSVADNFIIDGVNGDFGVEDMVTFSSIESVNSFINYLVDGFKFEKLQSSVTIDIYYINAPISYRSVNANLKYKRGFQPKNFKFKDPLPRKSDFKKINKFFLIHPNDVFDVSYIPKQLVDAAVEEEEERKEKEAQRIAAIKHNNQEYLRITKEYEAQIANQIAETDFKLTENKITMFFVIDDAPLPFTKRITDIAASNIEDSELFLTYNDSEIPQHKNLIYQRPISSLKEIKDILSLSYKNPRIEYRIAIFSKDKEQWQKLQKVRSEIAAPRVLTNDDILNLRKDIGYNSLQIKIAHKNIIFDNINII